MQNTHVAQDLLDAKTLIERALPNESPEARLHMVGLMLLAPSLPDSIRPVVEGASKADQLVGMLKRGTTLDEVIKTFGIKKNSAYARISVVGRAHRLKVKHVDGVYVAA